MSSATAHRITLPWYVVVLGLFFIAQAIPVAAININALYYLFLPEFMMRLAYICTGVGLLLRSRVARHLGLLVIFAEGISVVLTLLFWGLQFIWADVEFQFSMKLYDYQIAPLPYIPALIYLLLGLFTWIQYVTLTTLDVRSAFNISSKLDRLFFSLAGIFWALFRKGFAAFTKL